MSARFMLDTDTVSYALRGEGPVGARLIAQRPSAITVSALTVAELRFGAERRKSKRLHKLVDSFCSGVTVLPFDAAAATQFGVLGALLAGRGKPIGQLDTLIAAHALAKDLTLVTNNTRHYSRVPGLRVENWMEPQ